VKNQFVAIDISAARPEWLMHTHLSCSTYISDSCDLAQFPLLECLACDGA